MCLQINKSNFIWKYHTPIYKRLDTEIKQREARKQKLKEQILKERKEK